MTAFTREIEAKLEGIAEPLHQVQFLLRELSALEARVEGLEGTLGGLVSAADENPFCPIGHLIEHVFPDARALRPRSEGEG